MRRALSIAFLVVLASALLALPAAAQSQRDPFEPQGGPDVVEPGPDGGQPDDEPGTNEPEAEPPPDGGLGNTGMDTQPWLVLAYTFVVMGIGAVAVGRVLSSDI
jgi:hypothetical protein